MTRKQHQCRYKIPRSGRWGALAICIVLLMTVIATLGTAAFGQTSPKVTISPAVEPSQPVLIVVDGQAVRVESVEWRRGEQAMVWLRDLEALGWGTASVASDGSVLFKSSNGVTLTFTKGQNLAKVNSLAVHLTVETYLKDGRLMVPLSFVAKSLGYEYDISTKVVATVNTTPVKTIVVNPNTLSGTVTYAGKGIGGITVRAVDREFKSVKGAVAKTASDGSYSVTGLPDGEFMAYVYVEDNPEYFNRASEMVTVKGGQTVQLKPIAVGRIISPVSPKPGASVAPVSGKIVFEWEALPLASSYELVIRMDTYDEGFRIMSKTTNAQVSAASLKAGQKYEAVVIALDASGEYLGGTVGFGDKAWRFTLAAPTGSR